MFVLIKKKNYETYIRSARVQVLNNFEGFWSILNYTELSGTISDYLRLSWTISDYLGLSRTISDYLELFRAILGYLGLSRTISAYIVLSRTISGYLWLSRTISGYLVHSHLYSILVQVAPLVANFGEIDNPEFLSKNGPQIWARCKRLIKGRYLGIGATLGI